MATVKSAFILLCQLACSAVAVSLTVDLKCNKYAGVSTPNDITQWLGMRYAAPPVGDLRFMPPEDPPCNDTVQMADRHGKLPLTTEDTPYNNATSEDCLFLDVYAPSNATTESKLPVFFFIPGGGFNENTFPNYNGSGLIEASGHSIVVVTFNYRVGPYGFITNGDLITPNNGLRDQRKALEWVQKYISLFGGDPDHVVLGGASAGAASISLQLTAYGGRDTGLFHAAAAESVSFAPLLTIEEAQFLYDGFAARVGCTGDDSLACMRSKTAEELQEQNIGIPYPGLSQAPMFPWNPVIDHDLINDYTHKSFTLGKFVKVPVIYGDVNNGGTILTPRNTSTASESADYVHAQFPFLKPWQLRHMESMYPNPNDTCPSVGCYWRQVSNLYGDMRYMCPGLHISAAMSQYGMRGTYNYRWNVEDPTQVALGKGVPHVAEVHAVWGPRNTVGDVPKSLFPGGSNAAVVPLVQAYWTSFIRSFDPNTYRLPGSPAWETFNNWTQNRLLFETGGTAKMEPVDKETRYRCRYFKSIDADSRQ